MERKNPRQDSDDCGASRRPSLHHGNGAGSASVEEVALRQMQSWKRRSRYDDPRTSDCNGGSRVCTRRLTAGASTNGDQKREASGSPCDGLSIEACIPFRSTILGLIDWPPRFASTSAGYHAKKGRTLMASAFCLKSVRRRTQLRRRRPRGRDRE